MSNGPSGARFHRCPIGEQLPLECFSSRASDTLEICEDTATLTVGGVELTFDGLDDNDEEEPGGVICTFDEPGQSLPALILTAAPFLTGTVHFDVPAGDGNIQLYLDPLGTDVVPNFDETWDASELPKTYYVKGYVVSGSAGDVEFRLRYEGEDGPPCEDRVRLTVCEPTLESVKFTSDHGLLRDKNDDYEPGGNLFPEPEWERTRTPQAVPISHTMSESMAVELNIAVAPANAPSAQFVLSTQGPPGFDFSAAEALQGGSNLVTVTAGDLLEQKIQKVEPSIEWKLSHAGRTCLKQEASPTAVYVTLGTPRDPADPRHQVTQIRMERAVDFGSLAGTLNPHEIIQEVIWASGEFDLQQPRANAWDVPELRGDCQSIVRFAEKVAKMLNVPGTFGRRNIYAVASDPATAIENDPLDPVDCCGLNSDPRGVHPNGIWLLALVDGNNGCNAYEAVAKFTACAATRFYPGGVPGLVVDNKDDVLWVFDSLSWISASPCGVEEVVYDYPEVVTSPFAPSCP